MTDFDEFQKFASKVLDRVVKLETHIINIIHPIQTITSILQSPNEIKDLIKFLSQPLEVNYGELPKILNEFRKTMQEFREEMKEHSVQQTFNEIKYIGNRLNNIESCIESIKKEGITQKVKLDFVVDGYDLVKKQIGYDPQDPVENPNEDLKALLKTLTSRHAKVIIHRFGLFGEKEKTFKEIGEFFKVSGNQTSMILKKAIRMLRHPSRKYLVNKIKHGKLKKAITGDGE